MVKIVVEPSVRYQSLDEARPSSREIAEDPSAARKAVDEELENSSSSTATNPYVIW